MTRGIGRAAWLALAAQLPRFASAAHGHSHGHSHGHGHAHGDGEGSVPAEQEAASLSFYKLGAMLSIVAVKVGFGLAPRHFKSDAAMLRYEVHTERESETKDGR